MAGDETARGASDHAATVPRAEQGAQVVAAEPDRGAGATTQPAAATSSATASDQRRGTRRVAAGDGSASRRRAASPSWTTWPATRSHAVGAQPAPTSPASRPCRTARWTSPRTPPGSVALRNCER